MGARALQQAMERAECTLRDVDCIVCANGTFSRPVPCTASAIQCELGDDARGIPCFDIDATCLSFVTALNLMTAALFAGQYQRVAIISTEVASCGLNLRHVESAGLFGDGAAACIIEKDISGSGGIAGYHMVTDAKFNSICSIPGGGSDLPAQRYSQETASQYLFQMDGPLLLKRILRTIKPFLKELYNKAGCTQQDIRCVIPHQASPRGVEIVRDHLGFSEAQWFSIVEDYGNCIAASIPMALDIALTQGKVRTGDPVLLLGTGAGLSLAGAVVIL
jgi:3-oxoacyl-[acyl-carrier-protein] synthase-3